ncbi:uncharacterized protein LOC113459943 [Zonotrichia albicollis]|uniref:uncharacterized protein LOC113459943 n=1 Tax=Zonotrichia albicollis TaxID=44394 RepID=UPI003D80F968
MPRRSGVRRRVAPGGFHRSPPHPPGPGPLPARHPGSKGETPGVSAARRPAGLPPERERAGDAGEAPPQAGGHLAARRGAPLRGGRSIALGRITGTRGSGGGRATRRGEYIQGEGNTSSPQTSCRMSRLGAGWRRDPRSSDYPARTFDASHTDTHSRRRRRRSEARAPPQSAAPRRGGTAGARTSPRDAVAAHTPPLRPHSHFRGHVRGEEENQKICIQYGRGLRKEEKTVSE